MLISRKSGQRGHFSPDQFRFLLNNNWLNRGNYGYRGQFCVEQTVLYIQILLYLGMKFNSIKCAFFYNFFFKFQGGMIRNRHFVTANVRAKKFYQREGGQNDNSFGTGSDYGNLTILGGEDENYPFASDDEDYFAEFDTMDDDDDYDIMIES